MIMNKYVIIFAEENGTPTFMKWAQGDEQKLLTFDAETSAQRFIDNLANTFLFNDIYYCEIIKVNPAITQAIDCLDLTNFIPVQNGNDIELKEVND